MMLIDVIRAIIFFDINMEKPEKTIAWVMVAICCLVLVYSLIGKVN